MMEYEQGGLNQEGGSIDPVSGNDVPPGALQEEVRDDIDARLSEGEFVFPADVVRYIGLEKLMMMRQAAKSGLGKMEDMGQMGNATEVPTQPEPSATYYDIPDDMDLPEATVVQLEMAEGGNVNRRYKTFKELTGLGGGDPDIEDQGYELVTYINGNGKKIFVVEVNGEPTNPVPEGYFRTEETPGVGEDTDKDSSTSQQQQQQYRPRQPQFDVDDGEGYQDEPSSAVITTGGYIEDGRVHGGTQWNKSKNWDGSITLTNSVFGEVSLSKEEAATLGLGDGEKGSFKDLNMPKNIAGMFGQMLDKDGKYKDRQTNLSSGVKGNPRAGNAIHRDLVERADIQKKGRDIISAGSSTVNKTDIKTALAESIGKTDFADGGIDIVGGIASGKTAADLGITPDQYESTKGLMNALEGNIDPFANPASATTPTSNLTALPPDFADPKSPSALSMTNTKIGDDSNSDKSPTQLPADFSTIGGSSYDDGPVTYTGSKQNDASSDDGFPTTPVNPGTSDDGFTPVVDLPGYDDGYSNYNNNNNQTFNNDPFFGDEGDGAGQDEPSNDSGNSYDDGTGAAMVAKGGLLTKRKKTKKKKRKGLASRK
jgi:hypothetical protein